MTRGYVVIVVSIVVSLAGCNYLQQHIPWFNSKQSTAAPTAEAKPAAAKEPTRTLYDRLGGESAIRALVDDFIPRALADEKVNFARKGAGGRLWEATPENITKLEQHMVQFFGVATGGPQKYQGQDMGSAHKGMKITDEQFEALVNDLKASLDKLAVGAGEQKELMEIVAATRGVIVEPK